MNDTKAGPNPTEPTEQPAAAPKVSNPPTPGFGVSRDEIKKRERAYQRQRSKAQNAKARVQQRRMSRTQGR